MIYSPDIHGASTPREYMAFNLYGYYVLVLHLHVRPACSLNHQYVKLFVLFPGIIDVSY